MKKKKKLFIRRSCLTGKIVWAWRGYSSLVANDAYYNACKKEVERIKNWSETVAVRAARIMGLLTACTKDMAIDAEMTDEQREAARRLLDIHKKDVPCYREFYDHIMEERRRRQETRELHRQMREREALEKKHKTDYDKQQQR